MTDPQIWRIVRSEEDHPNCLACGRENEPWQLVFAKVDDPTPVWLCLSCLGAEIRTEPAERARRYWSPFSDLNTAE